MIEIIAVPLPSKTVKPGCTSANLEQFGSALGLRMKRECPQVGLVFGYTGGYYEYWLPEEEYDLSFETQKSIVPKGDPEILAAKYIQASKLLG